MSDDEFYNDYEEYEEYDNDDFRNDDDDFVHDQQKFGEEIGAFERAGQKEDPWVTNFNKIWPDNDDNWMPFKPDVNTMFRDLNTHTILGVKRDDNFLDLSTSIEHKLNSFNPIGLGLGYYIAKNDYNLNMNQKILRVKKLLQKSKTKITYISIIRYIKLWKKIFDYDKSHKETKIKDFDEEDSDEGEYEIKSEVSDEDEFEIEDEDDDEDEDEDEFEIEDDDSDDDSDE